MTRVFPTAFSVAVSDATELKTQIKQTLVENCMLKISADQIGDEQLLFGPDSLGLDSIDALQLAVALETKYKLKFADPEMARKILKNVNSIAAAIQELQTPAT